MKGTCRGGFLKNHNSSVRKTQAKDNPDELSSLAPSIGFVHVGKVGCRSLFFL